MRTSKQLAILLFRTLLLGSIVLASNHALSQVPGKKFQLTSLEFERFLASDASSKVQFLANLGDHPINRPEPVMVFIPGLPGSKLLDTSASGEDQVVWGCAGDAFFSDDRLSYDTHPDLHPLPLLGPDSPIDDCAHGIYETFFQVMSSTALSDSGLFLNFSYDWRQRIKHSAADLDIYLRQHQDQLSGRDIVFIAHSMGGLVLKYWYFEHCHMKEKDYNFSILKIYFVGTPHNGSYSAVLALKHGHTLVAKTGTLLAWLEARFFGALNDHGLTFPSFYQLLPAETSSQHKSTYIPSVGQSGRTSPLDLLIPGTWKRLGFPNTDIIRLPPGVSDLQEFYSTRLPSYLKHAKELHEELKKKPIIPSSRYVYSFQHETPNGLSAWDEKGSRTLASKVTFGERSGDGIVSADSAKDMPKSVDLDHMVRIDEKHEHLIVDEKFIDMILELKATASRGWQTAAAKMWMEDEDIVAQFADHALLLPESAEIKAWSPAGLAQYKCALAGDSQGMSCDRVLDSTPAVYALDKGLYYFWDMDSAVAKFNAKVMEVAANAQNMPITQLSGDIYQVIGGMEDVEWQGRAYLDYISLQNELLEQGSGNLLSVSQAWWELGEILRKEGRVYDAWFPANNAYQLSKVGVEMNLEIVGEASYMNVLEKSAGSLKELEKILGVPEGSFRAPELTYGD